MYAISLLRYEGTFTIRWNPSPLHSPPPPLPVYIRASLNLMVLYGETRSGQGYKARYGNSILVENSSKPGTLRFPGRTAPVVFERGGSMPNYRREYLTRVARLVSLFACIYPLRDAVWKKYFDEYCFETIQKEKKRCVCETNICPNTVTGWLFVSMRNNEVDQSISRFDKLPTHGKYFKSGFCRID